jgi:hypothetical protein
MGKVNDLPNKTAASWHTKYYFQVSSETTYRI